MSDPRIALLFPGQASQYVGMAKALSDSFPEALDVLNRAENAVGFSLRSLCFTGPEDQLALTEFQQPCVFSASVAAFQVLQTRLGITPFCAAGHSLGEYSALCAAGSFNLEDAAWLVRQRGKLMQETVAPGIGAMAALMGSDRIDAQGLCDAVSDDEFRCWPANFNSAGQVVISGHTKAIEAAKERAKEFGVRKFVLLKVSAPFHTPLMKPAAEKFCALLKNKLPQSPNFSVYSNVNAKFHEPFPEAISKNLVAQIYSPVQFESIGLALAQSQPDLVIEVGPGKVLSGLLGKIAPEIKILRFDHPDHLGPIEKELS